MSGLMSDYIREFSRGNWDHAVDDRNLVVLLNEYFTMPIHWEIGKSTITTPFVMGDLQSSFLELKDFAKMDFFLCFPYIHYHNVPAHRPALAKVSKLLFQGVDELIDRVVAKLPKMLADLTITKNELIIKAKHVDTICLSAQFKTSMPDTYLIAIEKLQFALGTYVTQLQRPEKPNQHKKSHIIPESELTETQKRMFRNKEEKQRLAAERKRTAQPEDTKEDWDKLYEIMNREARNHQQELEAAAKQNKMARQQKDSPVRDCTPYEPNKLSLRSPNRDPAAEPSEKIPVAPEKNPVEIPAVPSSTKRKMLLRPYTYQNGETVHRVISDSHKSALCANQDIRLVPESMSLRDHLSLVRPVTLMAAKNVQDLTLSQLVPQQQNEEYLADGLLDEITCDHEEVVGEDNANDSFTERFVFEDEHPKFQLIDEKVHLDGLLESIQQNITLRELAQLTQKHPELFQRYDINSKNQQIMAAFLLHRFDIDNASQLLNLKISETSESISINDSVAEKRTEVFFEMNFDTMEWARWRKVVVISDGMIEESIEYLDLPESQIHEFEAVEGSQFYSNV